MMKGQFPALSDHNNTYSWTKINNICLILELLAIQGKENKRKSHKEKKKLAIFKDHCLQCLAMSHRSQFRPSPLTLTPYHKQMKPLPQAGD